MVLGIRYCKTFEFGQAPRTNGGADFVMLVCQSDNGTPYCAGNNGGGIIPVAPARYSQVRKVVFWCNARSETETITARLRMSILPTVQGTKVPFEVSMAPSSITRWSGVGTVFPSVVFDPGELFDQVGTTTSNNLPISGAGLIDGPATLLKIEFDRFEADSADFFAVWDSVTSDDAYLGFRFVIERMDGNNWGNNDYCNLANMACTIVQAPAQNNRTCTIISGTSGPVLPSQTAKTTPDTYRAAHFRYIASEWDNITGVYVLGATVMTGGVSVRNWNTYVNKVATFEPDMQTTLYTEAFSDNVNINQGDRSWFRTADIKQYLEDGAFLDVLFENTAGGGSQIDHITAWFEIVQEGFTNTVCHHPAGSAQRNGFNSGGLYGSPATGFFDPTWYQSFPDDLILDRKLYLTFRHLSIVVDTAVQLFIDANLQSDVTQLVSSSASMAGISPSLNSTPVVTAGRKSRFVSGFSPDPINLAGTRRLVWGIITPTLTTEDFQGDGGIYYVLAVPASEIPEVGDVFELGEFNPEGCASTAAGLGDPGVLVITNGSTIPKKFNPMAGVIEDAGVPQPFCDETLPSSVVDDTAASPTGGLQPGVYTYRYTFRNCCTGKESNPNDADIVVDASAASPAAEITLNFTNVRIPGDPQICEICIYRTVIDGVFPVMAKVGCFDPDVQSTFVDTVPDDELDFVNDPLSTLNAPPPCTPIVVELKNRLVFMGDIPQLSPAGTVSVVEGSEIVTGSYDVEWDRCLEGKYIQLEGDCRPYEILCVMPPEEGMSPAIQRLKLIEPYEGASQLDALYTICGHPNRVWFSEPFEAEYVPESSFIDIDPGDGDRIMGAVSNFDSLLICKRRKTYVMRWRDNPVLEITSPPLVSRDIGCIAYRSFAQIESGSVFLSDRGLALFDGRSVQMIPESAAFNDFFTDPNNPNYVKRDSLGRVVGAVGVFYPKREQYLLLLPTADSLRGANMLMVWDTHLRNITVHRFCQEFLSMEIGKDSDGNQRVYIGDSQGFVWILDIGHADGVGYPGQTGTVTGTITAAGIDPALGASYIEDSSASFLTGGLPGLAGLSGVAGLSAAFGGDDLGLAGVCVFFRAQGAALDAVWESRTIYAATQTRLYVTPPFTSANAGLDGYDYMIGPIDFRAEFKPTNFGDDDSLKRNWRQIVVHEPEEVSSEIRVELRPDFQLSDDEELSVVGEDGETGAGRVFNLNFAKGRQVQPVGRRLYDFEQVVITNFAPNSPVRLINHVMAAAPHTSK